MDCFFSERGIILPNQDQKLQLVGYVNSRPLKLGKISELTDCKRNN